MNCMACKCAISQDRAEFIRDLNLPQTCKGCSRVQAPRVFMSYDGKTAGQLVVVPNNPDGTVNTESVRKADACYRRQR